MGDPTPFVEANALLFAQEDDIVSEVRARRLLRDMLPGELLTLAKACERLGRWATVEAVGRG